VKPKHVFAEGVNARDTLALCEIDIGAEHLALRPTQVTALIAEADRARYQKPAGAKGSRARYFHDMLQLRASAQGVWTNA
jgi:hypothetical protein